MDKQEMVCPKKDTCIFASKIHGHCVPHFKTEGCTGCFGDGGVVYSLGCVPVEPAQPELPREDIVNQLLEDAVKKLSVELRQALKRIAELKVALLKQGGIIDGQYTKITELLAEIASLKEKLAGQKQNVCHCEPTGEPVVIPSGKYCGDCGFRSNDYCDEPADVMVELEVDASGNFLKAPGCPVPAKEEAE